MTNKEIAAQLNLIAKLLDIHQESSFKSKSYSNAAFAVDRYPSAIASIPSNQIAGTRGLGENMARTITELIETNEIKYLNELIERTPKGILQMISIKGIGPKKISTIWHELGIETPGELLYACYENRLVKYKGFGEKTQQTIIEAVEYFLASQGSILFANAEKLCSHLVKMLEPIFGNGSIIVSGQVAEQCETVDEIYLLILSEAESIFEALSNQPNWKLLEDDGETFTFKFHDHLNIIIQSANEEDLSSKIFFSVSSAEFIEAFENNFPEADYNQPYSNYDASIFDAVGLPFIAPCLRYDTKSIILAKNNNLPKLIEISDIKGIIHNHSTWSDGKNTLYEMALACKQKGFEYLVISDHSVSSFYANGLSVERIYQQHEEIDTLNEKLHPFKIFKSIECDILGDGRLDYSNDVLASFDLVITSIHQNLVMNEEKAMQRLLAAIDNPFTKILGHPTGRLLLSRKGYETNMPLLIDACLKQNVAIELNANPRRLDIDWRFIPLAIEAGVMLSINPDAHSIDGIDDIYYGVKAAQKGMMEARHNLSSLSLIEFEAYLSKKNKLSV